MAKTDLNGDDDVFEKFEPGDDIVLQYNLWDYPDKDTEINTTIATFASNGELVWKAGKTGNGRITKNGQVIDGNGVKVGRNASIKHLD